MEDNSRNADRSQGRNQGERRNYSGHSHNGDRRSQGGRGYRGGSHGSSNGGYRGRDDRRNGGRDDRGRNDDRKGYSGKRDDRGGKRYDRNDDRKGYRGNDDKRGGYAGNRDDRKGGYKGGKRDDFRGNRGGDDRRNDRRFDRKDGENRSDKRYDRKDDRGGKRFDRNDDRKGGYAGKRDFDRKRDDRRGNFGDRDRKDGFKGKRDDHRGPRPQRDRQDFKRSNDRPDRRPFNDRPQREGEATESRDFDAEEGEEKERTLFPEFFASCQVGLEDALARELKSFGIKKTRPLGGGVTFYTEKERAYRALLWSRLASRILLVVDRVGANDADDLYRNVRQLPWHKIIAEDAKIAVFGSGGNEQLRNTRFISQRVKDGICDKIRQVRGERPDVDSKHPDAVISVRVARNRATISFDLAGESLYHRSYIRKSGGQNAAVDVAMANAMLGAVNWRTLGYRRHYRMVDPVCNNPMLVVEAAAEVADRAPGLTRSIWGFNGWGEHDADMWNQLLDDADQRFEEGLKAVQGMGALTLGISTSDEVAEQAVQCLKAAGVEGLGRVVSVNEESVAPAVDRAMKAACRAAESAIKQAEANDEADKPVVRQACLVAANLLPEHDTDGYSLVRAGELFMRAAEQAPAGSVFAEVGGDLGAVYGHAPVEESMVGGKKIDAPLLVFSKPPVPRIPITVVGLEDGVEHTVPVYEQGTEQFASRLRKMAKERRKWAQAMGISCYRIYDADLLDYMVAIDRYEDLDGEAYLYIAEYAAPSSVDRDRARRRFEDVMAIAPVVLGVPSENIYSKTRMQAKGGAQYRDAGRDSRVILCQEGGFTFEIDLGGRLDTGLFLDHRITRRMLQQKAAGKRFLNLFAYTGSATVYAAGGGARNTVTVDLSGNYLSWAERNMERNGFEGRNHRFEHADVMTWINDARRKHRMFDLIFVDPPTFSNSKQMGAKTWDVQRDHAEMLIGVAHLLETSGQAVFSCNLKGFKPDLHKLARFGVALEDISEETIPQDFERRTNIHKCYLVHRMTPEEREKTLAELEEARKKAKEEAQAESEAELAAAAVAAEAAETVSAVEEVIEVSAEELSADDQAIAEAMEELEAAEAQGFVPAPVEDVDAEVEAAEKGENADEAEEISA